MNFNKALMHIYQEENDSNFDPFLEKLEKNNEIYSPKVAILIQKFLNQIKE